MNIEQAALENKLNEQEIFRQTVEEKNQRIWELQKRVEILEDMLNRAASVRVAYPQPQPQRLPEPAKRRWSVR